MPADQPRYLHRRSVPAYSRLHTQAMFGEPEAVSADVQDDITARAHRRQRAIWTVDRDRILAEIEQLTVDVPHPHVRRGARALRRELAAIDRKLTASA